ncbi:MAG: glutamate-5-semialdehyde dehydrogenase [Eubacteriales bacterium]|nr:glutamate-5-semialdehyde dehydrogenase [Eubacteriales bacterium]
MTVREIAKRAKEASFAVKNWDTNTKNQILLAVAAALENRQNEILVANALDLEAGEENGLSAGLLDRLTLTTERISQMATGLRQLSELEDPIGGIEQMKRRPNGLLIGRRRVPLGVVGVIYEARPNVTVDVFGLCLKTGNTVILKGGSDAAYTNQVLVGVIRSVLRELSVEEDQLQLLSEGGRDATKELMRLREYIDVLIPRGGAGLIRAVVENSSIPVIETGVGNCHIYVHEQADMDMAMKILINAKTQRISVCNACESLVVDRAVAADFLPRAEAAFSRLQEGCPHVVEMVADDEALLYLPSATAAMEEDYSTEFGDYKISVKVVDDIYQAIHHINTYSSGHSEAIITNDYRASRLFLEGVDSAAVYVNASTRFTDGFEFGFGAEIGISTQKLHARGPMGLEALTTTKFVIMGDGQIRG